MKNETTQKREWQTPDVVDLDVVNTKKPTVSDESDVLTGPS